jgi:uncharacterized protein (TIGR03000 family)
MRTGILAIVLAVVAPAIVEAGHPGGGGGGGGGYHGGGGGGGYHGGGGYGGYGGYHGGYGGYGYRGGYGGYYGRGYYGGYGRGFYGFGFGYPGYWPYYGYGYGFDDFAGYPSYPYVDPYVDGPALVAGANVPSSDSRRFYPPTMETAPFPVEADRALVAVRLPANAQLFFQGTEMTMTGPERTFRSPPLDANRNYRYDITARWTENGKPVERSRSLMVKAGQKFSVDLMTDN